MCQHFNLSGPRRLGALSLAGSAGQNPAAWVVWPWLDRGGVEGLPLWGLQSFSLEPLLDPGTPGS